MTDWRAQESAQALQDLRALRENFSLEALRTFVSDRQGSQEMYDHRDAAWRRTSPQEGA